MEKEEIRKKVIEMKTVNDLTSLLNEIKRDEFRTKLHPITRKQLLHFSNPEIKVPKFRTFAIPKKNGKPREINAPCYQLSILLHCFNILFKAVYTPSESAMGFAEGKSIVDNARLHVGHNYVLNIDLSDFFSSIPKPRVWARLQLPPFNFSKEIASVVAGLCCYKSADGTIQVLPQGAATSPILTNAICDKLDRRMRGVASRFGVHYSRYADDMSFSSMHNVYQEDGEFMQEIKRIVEDQGFKMNENKTRLLKNGQRQEVTGITVNERVNVARKYVRDIRCILHLWETKGYAQAYGYFYPHYKAEKGYIKKGEPIMENVIGGKLDFLKMVKGTNNSTYLSLKKRFDNLQQVLFMDNETDKSENYIYVQPYKLIDFESMFSTKISLEVSTRGKLIGKCKIGKSDKILPVSKSTQKELCDNLTIYTPGSIVEVPDLKDCFVTLCRQKGKNFWLITKFEPKRSKCLSIQNVNIDVDELLAIWENDGIEAAVAALFYVINHNDSEILPTDRGQLPQSENYKTVNGKKVKTGKKRGKKLFPKPSFGTQVPMDIQPEMIPTEELNDPFVEKIRRKLTCQPVLPTPIEQIPKEMFPLDPFAEKLEKELGKHIPKEPAPKDLLPNSSDQSASVKAPNAKPVSFSIKRKK